MNVGSYRFKNTRKKVWARLTHPWPVYKKVGGINAVVHRADGSVENLGQITTAYAKRWGTGTGQ